MSHHLLCLSIFFTSILAFAQEPPPTKNVEARLGAIYGTQNYDLESSGFATSSGVSQSSGLQASAIYKNYILSYQKVTSTASTPNLIEPGEIKSQVQRISLLNKFPMINPPFEVGKFKDLMSTIFGFEWRKRRADATTPNVFMPDTDQIGIYGAIWSQFEWTNLWSAEIQAGLFIPLYMDERSDKTGYYKYSLNPDLALDLVYQVNHFIDFSVGADIAYEHTKFSGSGDRGANNATETYMNLYFPIELRFQF